MAGNLNAIPSIMKLNKTLSIFAAALAVTGLAGCEGEKDLIIIEGNLPIKTTTLYMVGDATPAGWSIDSPTPLSASGDDPLVFTWEGSLVKGEMKLCLVPGSWDNPFIRPANAGEEIGRQGLPETTFVMHAGDPDNKWNIADAGVYSLRFDLREWTMSATFLREADAPEIKPIETETLYIVGNAAPCEWNINDPSPLVKISDYKFVYEGPLVSGELKACLTTGSWDVPFVRPGSNGCRIDRNGIENDDFVYTASPDDKWIVAEPGIYRLTFDLEAWKVSAEYTGEFVPAARLYMIGEATDGGWSWDAATVVEASAGDNTLFVWEGELGRGSLKASLEKDFGAPFYRPAFADCVISADGVASHEMVFTDGPDDKWLVTDAGRYRLTFDTKAMTFDAVFLEEKLPALYIIGDATAGGWSLDDATVVNTKVSGLYTWTGELKEGEMKACLTRDFSAPFYRPSFAACEISESGAASSEMVFTTDPDDKWLVTLAGTYRLTFNTVAMTFEAEYIK